MQKQFQADCYPLLIGSMPMKDHEEAAELVLKYTPEIPVWVQLPVYAQERMIPQFMPGLPGLVQEEDGYYIDSSAADFDEQLLEFYEEYMAVIEGNMDSEESRFVLGTDEAKGLDVLVRELESSSVSPLAVKGQVTGPFTFCTGVHDENKNAIFYNDQLRDAAIKLLALKARWQVKRLARAGRPVIIFCDEPALAGYGTSEFISVSREEVVACLAEVIEAIHAEGGLAGVHVCANTDWSLILDSPADIVNFDAYAYFDRFILYADLIKKFLDSGRILAWGIVPTLNTEDVEKETTESLITRWSDQAHAIEDLGFDRSKIRHQSLITPSCGAGSLPIELAGKVVRLTREVSDGIRSRF